jgi:hypothetical protein
MFFSQKKKCTVVKNSSNIYIMKKILFNKLADFFNILSRNRTFLQSYSLLWHQKKTDTNKKWTLNGSEIKEVGKSLLFFSVTLCFMCLNACQKTNPPPTLPYVEPPIHINYWDTLPAITQEGWNTIGCKVNGKVWVPLGAPFGNPNYSSTFDESKGLGYGEINAKIKLINPNGKLTISFSPSYFLPNQFATNSNFNTPFTTVVKYVDQHAYYADTSSLGNSNFLKITHIDTVRNFVAGFFQFTVYRGQNYKITDRSDSIVFTDGRFDLRYVPE